MGERPKPIPEGGLSAALDRAEAALELLLPWAHDVLDELDRAKAKFPDQHLPDGTVDDELSRDWRDVARMWTDQHARDGLGAVPREGIAVVRGENGGNTHLLVAEGDVTFAPAKIRGQSLGTLVVGEKSVAYLTHPEHGFMGMAPGSYIIKRQREQAETLRLVAD